MTTDDLHNRTRQEYGQDFQLSRTFFVIYMCTNSSMLYVVIVSALSRAVEKYQKVQKV